MLFRDLSCKAAFIIRIYEMYPTECAYLPDDLPFQQKSLLGKSAWLTIREISLQRRRSINFCLRAPETDCLHRPTQRTCQTSSCKFLVFLCTHLLRIVKYRDGTGVPAPVNRPVIGRNCKIDNLRDLPRLLYFLQQPQYLIGQHILR